MAERDERGGVYGAVNPAFGFCRVHDLSQALMAITHPHPKQFGYIGLMAGRGKGLQQQAGAVGQLAIRLGLTVDQMATGNAQDVFHPARKPVIGEQLIELAGGRMINGFRQQLGLAPVSRVDGPRRDPGPASDLRHPGPGVAALSEFCGSRQQQARTKGVVVCAARIGCNLQDGV